MALNVWRRGHRVLWGAADRTHGYRLKRHLSNSSYLAQIHRTTSLEWSYLHVPGPQPLLDLTIGRAVDRAHDLYGDTEALVSVHEGIRKSFSQVKTEAEVVAAGLVSLGLQRGDRLGMWGTNNYHWYITQMAAAKAGLVLVNVNPAYRSEELLFCLNKVGIKALICDRDFKTSDYYSMVCSAIPEVTISSPGQIKSSAAPHFKTLIVHSTDVSEHLPGAYKFADLYEAGDSSHMKIVQELGHRLQLNECANIQFTSGTTGTPKGAMLSHQNVVNNAAGIGGRSEFNQYTRRICVQVPMFHCFGCVIGSLCGLLYGATCVFPSPRFDADASVRCLEQEKITTVYGTPTMFIDMLAAFKKNPVNVSTLSDGIMAGAPCPQELLDAVMNKLNMPKFLVMYGMTETSPVTFQCFPDDPPHVRCTTVGFPSDHIEVMVINSNNEMVRAGESGELCIRGNCNFLGYWDDKQKTEESYLPGGWFKTGDLAVLQPDGYGQIVGRKSDMIIRGGENIYPAELENFLMGHQDILEAQVFGVPDNRLGEKVCSWVRSSEGSQITADDIKNWCKGKIAHYKIPDLILFKADFPRTVSGKIQKFKMKEITVEELGNKL